MFENLSTGFSGSSVADGLISAVIAIPLIWGLTRLIRLALRRAKRFSEQHLEMVRVAVGRYSASSDTAKLTFQNYLKTLLDKSKSEITFNSSVLVAVAAALPTASKDLMLLAWATTFGIIFAFRLVGSLGEHVRNQMIEEAIYEPLSIENTKALMAQHSGSQEAQHR